jgi:hypothetical protein
MRPGGPVVCLFCLGFAGGREIGDLLQVHTQFHRPAPVMILSVVAIGHSLLCRYTIPLLWGVEPGEHIVNLFQLKRLEFASLQTVQETDHYVAFAFGIQPLPDCPRCAKNADECSNNSDKQSENPEPVHTRAIVH